MKATPAVALAVPDLEPATERPLDRLGRPLHDLRISVTDRCNFRCGYCMPRDVFHDGYAFAPRSEILSFEEITRIATIAVRDLGARKLRLTGGEPLLRRDLPALVAQLARIEGLEDLTLTTNGFLLADQARALADAGLQRVTVSLDALDAATFGTMAGLLDGADQARDRVLAGIEAAERAGLSPIKINCVVQRGMNEHAVADLARHFRGTPHVVRFIEFMDVGTLNAWRPDRVVSASEIHERVSTIAPLEALDTAKRGDVAERFRYADGSGEVGIIASVTRPFCADCNRARLAAEGRWLHCLFATQGLDLRTPLRSGASDAELTRLLVEGWRARADRYSELRAELNATGAPRRRLEMYQIGG